MTQNLVAIILAAGKSKRFSDEKSKMLYKLNHQQEMIIYPLKLLEKLHISHAFVLGHQKEALIDLICKKSKQPVAFAYQREQLGTGHALACSEKLWTRENILVLNGDMPLVDESLLTELIDNHLKSHSDVSFVIFKSKNPESYGRVFKENNQVKIVEFKDCSSEQAENNLVNAGIYLFKTDFLKNSIHLLDNKNASGEFYITDLIGLASDAKKVVNLIESDEEKVLGVNDQADLERVTDILTAQ